MRIKTFLFVILAGGASTAWAHGLGMHTHGAGLFTGLAHPFTGLDHFLAMLAVGILAAQQGGRALWVLPATFVGTMLVGAMLGMTGMSLMGMEWMIALSVLMLGLLIAKRSHLPFMPAALLTAMFALFHGVAHGQEMSFAASPMAYATGMLFATTLLHTLGVLFGMKLRQLYLSLTGAAIAIAGVGMLFGLAG